MINKFTTYLNEAAVNLDYITQSNYYFDQIDDIKGWLPITDDLYDEIEEEGWVQDLTEDMDDDTYEDNREIIKSRFVYKELDLYYNWQKDHIKSKENYTINIFNKFDEELKNKQTFPYQTLDFIDYSNGKVYIIKFKGFGSILWSK